MIFIDLDGTLLDVSNRYYAAYKRVIEEFRGKVLTKKIYWDLKRKKSDLNDILYMSGLKISKERYQKRRFVYLNDFEFFKLDKLCFDLKKLFLLIKNENKIVLITLRPNHNKLIDQLSYLNVLEFFYLVLSSPSNMDNKWIIKKKLILNNIQNLKTKDSLFIGDSETDILTGKSLGIETVAVSYGIRDKSILKGHKPDHILNTPVDLFDFIIKKVSLN